MFTISPECPTKSDLYESVIDNYMFSKNNDILPSQEQQSGEEKEKLFCAQENVILVDRGMNY